MIRFRPAWMTGLLVFLSMLADFTRLVPAADEVSGADRSTLLDLELQDFRGKAWSLGGFPDSRVLVVAFLGTECPLARLYAPRLQQLADEFASQGVGFVTVFSNRHDSLTELASFARRHQLQVPVLKDPGNQLADLLHAERTPEVIVLDDQRIERYRGRIDDQYGVGFARPEPQSQELRDAINALLEQREVAITKTRAVGCRIGRVREPQSDSPVTYSNQVARLMQKHCVECHRPGEIAPFTLTNYEDVSGWAEMIQEVIHQQRMPPWHADPRHGRFQNERLLTEDEKDIIDTWVAHGAPEGDASQLPEPRKFVRGWNLPRKPDRIIPMRARPFHVPAEGTVEYQYFAVDTGFAEDRWVSATDIEPGNRAVVHHAIVFISPPLERRRRGLGWLAAYAPGQGSMQLPEGQARLIPAGSKLIFQMHYTPNGSPQKDLTRLGLVFADPETVREQVVTLLAVEPEFEIPAGARDFEVDTVFDRWPTNARLLSIAPHMHLRGKAFRVETIPSSTDETPEILLNVPGYDFNWQNAYRLIEPRPIPKDFAVRCVARFDNSEDNLVNPDPNSTVFWGDQSWEEMMVAFFEVAIPRDPASATPPDPAVDPRKQEWANATTDTLFERFDRNQDGRIEATETPKAFGVFAFRRMDANRDGRITREEAFEHALKRAPR